MPVSYTHLDVYKRQRYSCVGFILLQQLVEARTGMSMDEYLAKKFYTPMGLERTGYLPLRLDVYKRQCQYQTCRARCEPSFHSINLPD